MPPPPLLIGIRLTPLRIMKNFQNTIMHADNEIINIQPNVNNGY